MRKEHMIRSHWSAGLISVLGLCEILMAVSSRPAVAAVGIVGGVALVVAPWLMARSLWLGVGLLVLGVGPFQVLTWWAVVPVVVAVVAVAIAVPSLLRPSRGATP